MTDKEIDALLEADTQTMINDLRPKIRSQIEKEKKNMLFNFTDYQEDLSGLRAKILNAINQNISVVVRVEKEVQERRFDEELKDSAYSICEIQKRHIKSLEEPCEYTFRPKK